MRTLDLFVSTLVEAGGLPDGLVLTLPKVTTVGQVRAMDYACAGWRRSTGCPPDGSF